MELQLKMQIPELSNSGHAYLDELSSNALPYSLFTTETGERVEEWAKEREIYGFDSTETWDLASSFYAWLYERIRMYMDKAPKVVNIDYHKFNWKDEEYSQREILELILSHISFYFSELYDDFDEDDVAYVKEINELWALVLPVMWW